MMTDPIADMLTRLRNALNVNKREVMVPYSKIKMSILQIMIREGFIESAVASEGVKSTITVKLKYNGKMPALQDLKRVSKPGHRTYVKADEIKRVLNGFGMAILSTPRGVISDTEARQAKVGGEILCEIY